jgi:hypothetical protein
MTVRNDSAGINAATNIIEAIGLVPGFHRITDTTNRKPSTVRNRSNQY